MKYQKFIDSSINSAVKFNRDYGYPRTIFDAYGNPSIAKRRIANFLDRRVKYDIFNALNKKVERYGCLAYISAEGISTYSKFSFNYCLQYKIFNMHGDGYFYISVVFTKNYVYISDNKHNYRYAWNYDTDFGDIFYDWIELYVPDEGIYMH